MEPEGEAQQSRSLLSLISGRHLPRAARWRSVPDLFHLLAVDAATMVVLVKEGQLVLHPSANGNGTDSVADSVTSVTRPRLLRIPARAIAERLSDHVSSLVFLGAENDDPTVALPDATGTGPAYFACVADDFTQEFLSSLIAEGTQVPRAIEREVSADLSGVRPWKLGTLRDVGDALDPTDLDLALTAIAMGQWHRATRFCGSCGSATDVSDSGWVLRCQLCERAHYPRTDPAMIVTVLDDHDRLLLGHNAAWPDHRFSLLAGFIEPGESAEAAVRREVFEETGVEVVKVEYVASQPWPFPSSLMVAYRAYSTAAKINVDGVEITSARWFSRAELRASLDTGAVLLPARFSIARMLIDQWLDAR